MKNLKCLLVIVIGWLCAVSATEGLIDICRPLGLLAGGLVLLGTFALSMYIIAD